MLTLRLDNQPLPQRSVRSVPLVVVADDDEDILAMVVLRLERCGFDVVSARAGEAAAELVARLNPDLVVLDVAMPKMTGIDVCERLRADEATASTAVILLTASAANSDVERGLAAGADAYITKPFSPQDLAARIESLLAA